MKSICWILYVILGIVPIIIIFCPGIRSSDTHRTVLAREGDHVTLPCPEPFNMKHSDLTWKRDDRRGIYVYVHKDGRESTERRDPSYNGRVSLENSGGANLSLTGVTRSDEGKYICAIHLGEQPVIRVVVLKVSPAAQLSKSTSPLPTHRPGSSKLSSGMVGLLISVCVSIIVLFVLCIKMVIGRPDDGKKANSIFPA